MKEQLKSRQENEEREIVDVAAARTVVQYKWVFKNKYDQCDKMNYFALLVAKGFI